MKLKFILRTLFLDLYFFFFQIRTVWFSTLSFLERYLKLEEIINTVFVDTRVYIRNSRSFR